jgi:hypothetical protein
MVVWLSLCLAQPALLLTWFVCAALQSHLCHTEIDVTGKVVMSMPALLLMEVRGQHSGTCGMFDNASRRLSTHTAAAVEALRNASKVIIVPGW